jgi:hypothetical protein
MGKTYRYQAMTISKPTGTTYWNMSKPTLEQVYRHLDRYCHKYCDVLIYKYEVKYAEPEEWNAVGDIKFIEMYEGFYPRAQSISEIIPDCEGSSK